MIPARTAQANHILRATDIRCVYRWYRGCFRWVFERGGLVVHTIKSPRHVTTCAERLTTINN